jgi:CHAD domain-containing protein
MKIRDSQPDLSLTTKQFATRLFMELHQAIMAEVAGAIRGEVDAIHDMRVTIRRQRVALSNFASCLPHDVQRKLDVHLKNLAVALGRVRDLDVMIETLEAALLTRPAPDHQAIKNLISRLRARRRRQFRHLKNYLQNEEYAEFKRQFKSWEGESLPENQIAHGQAA